MSGVSLQLCTVKSFEQMLQEQESVNSADVYDELSRYGVAGSALSVCISRSDRDPNYSQRLERILQGLKTQLARMPGGELEVREIDRRYGPDSFDIRHFLDLAEKAHDFVSENIIGHFEDQKEEDKRDDQLDVDSCNPPLPFVPRSIGRLRSLTSLNFQDNTLTELPRELFDLVSLRILHLGDNRLTSIPEAIGRLRNLRVLDVDNNRLESLPRALDDLTNLETLRAANNRLSSFSVHIEKLHRLRSLYLYQNRISSLTIYPAPRLGCLHLEQNQLTRFPAVEVLPHGCHIYLSGNPFPPDNITMFKNEALEVYFVGYVKPELGKKRPLEDAANRQ
jgi:hypothetical protein